MEGVRCAGCEEPIKERYFLSAIGRHWHDECLRVSSTPCMHQFYFLFSVLVVTVDWLSCRAPSTTSTRCSSAGEITFVFSVGLIPHRASFFQISIPITMETLLRPRRRVLPLPADHRTHPVGNEGREQALPPGVFLLRRVRRPVSSFIDTT